MQDLIYRFILGGFIVSFFAVLGDVLKPKSFAGLFGAAPSVALATLSLTIHSNGKSYAATEARCMIAGAIGFLFYASFCVWLMKKRNVRALPATVSGLAVWFMFGLGAWILVSP
ncbi:MAG TPA: DUF3147 family protein [Terriglobia bacterium]|nr:DUF3147 family protein [Terriglobia bacterium]